jgi:hypothetical protein
VDTGKPACREAGEYHQGGSGRSGRGEVGAGADAGGFALVDWVFAGFGMFREPAYAAMDGRIRAHRDVLAASGSRSIRGRQGFKNIKAR